MKRSFDLQSENLYDLQYDKVLWFTIWIDHMTYSMNRSCDLQYDKNIWFKIFLYHKIHSINRSYDLQSE